MRKLFKERKLFKRENYMRKYGILLQLQFKIDKNRISLPTWQAVYLIIVLWADCLEESGQIDFTGLLTTWNIMDGFQWSELIPRFPHIAEAIFEKLDDRSLTRLGWFKFITVLSNWKIHGKDKISKPYIGQVRQYFWRGM